MGKRGHAKEFAGTRTGAFRDYSGLRAGGRHNQRQISLSWATVRSHPRELSWQRSENATDPRKPQKAVSRRDFLKIAGVPGGCWARRRARRPADGVRRGKRPLPPPRGGHHHHGRRYYADRGGTTTRSRRSRDGTRGQDRLRDSLDRRHRRLRDRRPVLRDMWSEAIGDGLVFGDGKKHPINFEVRDSQSDGMRAAQVAGDLIQDKVDIIMAAASPDTVNPVADQAEALGCPCITTDCPVEPYYFGRGATPDKPFKWTYHAFWGLQQIQNVSLSLWAQYPTNKVVGALWPNNTDGNAYRGSYPAFIEANGYKLVDGGPYQSRPRTSPCDQRVQAGGLRDLDRPDDPAGLHELLEASHAAGLAAQGRRRR